MKIRSYFFIVFFSLSFCQYFIVPKTPIYDLLKWEEIKSNQILIPKVGPFSSTQYNFSKIASYYYSDSLTGSIIKRTLYPEVNFNSVDGSRLRLYGTVGIALSGQLTLQNEFEFDNKGENDLHFQGVERGLKNGWVGYLQHSSLTYNYSNGHFSIGRGNPYIYNINESLLLSPNFPPAEYLWWQHEIKWFQYDWGLMLLNKIDTLNRFLTFHRYGMEADNWRVGFTEAVIVTYENWDGEEMDYVLPSTILLETEANRGIADNGSNFEGANLMWLFDGMLKWNKWTIYGELLIDDFALDGQSPPQIAGSIGLGTKFDNNTLINVEYTRINRWTGNYCRKDPELIAYNTWAEMGVPIGHSMGSDAHQVLVDSYYPLNDRLAVEVAFSWIENGDGSAIDRLNDWPNDIPCETNFGANGPPLSDRNTTYYSGGTLHYLLKENILANMVIGFRDNEVLLNLSISYRL